MRGEERIRTALLYQGLPPDVRQALTFALTEIQLLQGFRDAIEQLVKPALSEINASTARVQQHVAESGDTVQRILRNLEQM